MALHGGADRNLNKDPFEMTLYCDIERVCLPCINLTVTQVTREVRLLSRTEVHLKVDVVVV